MVRPDVLCGALTSDKPTVKLLVWPPDKLAETALLSFGMPASLRVIHSGQFDGVGLHEPGFSMSLFGRAIQGRTTLVLAVPGTPSIVAVIVVSPASTPPPSAVRLPVDAIVAMLVLELLHVSILSVITSPYLSSAIAVSWPFPPQPTVN